MISYSIAPEISGYLANRQDGEVIDASQFPEAAETDRVRSVPTLFVDGRLRVTGAIAGRDVETLLGQPERLGAEVLGRLLTGDNAEALAARFHQRRAVAPALVDLLAATSFHPFIYFIF